MRGARTISISLQSLIWLFLPAFMIHDFEEIIFVESWMRRNRVSARAALPKTWRPSFDRLADTTSAQFAVAVALEFIVFIPATWIAAEHQQYLFFLGFNAVLFLHVFTHVFQSLYLRKYTPGVVTAVLVTLPYSVWLCVRLVEEGLLDGPKLAGGLAACLVLPPIVALGHWLGSKIVPRD